MGKQGDHIFRVGVTGGIGSGKSLVCSIFSRFGVPVLSADDIAKELMHSDTGVRAKVMRLLGNESYTAGGELNRQYIASEVFSDKSLQNKLNAIVHPRVEEAIEQRAVTLANEGKKLVIVEAALIYEAGLDKKLDAVVVVDADEDVRIRRVVERDRVQPDDVRKRITAQWSNSRKVREADYVLRNNGSVEDLEKSVTFLYSIFILLAQKEHH